jgi:hypothetical protein
MEEPDSAKGEALAQMERAVLVGLERIQVLFVLESQLDGLDFLRGASGEIGNSTVFDFAVVTEGLAQEDAVIGFAVEGDFRSVEIHSEHNITVLYRICKDKMHIISGYIIGEKYTHISAHQQVALKS